MGLAVSCSQFEKQVQLLSKNYSLVSIDEFIETIDKQKNKFLVTLTFDDGYKDNLKYALPILEKYNIPATIYMSTRFLEKKVSMWWYEIKKLIENKLAMHFVRCWQSGQTLYSRMVLKILVSVQRVQECQPHQVLQPEC